ALRHFKGGFLQGNLHRGIELVGQRHNLAQRAVGNGVGRVRAKAEGEQRQVFVLVAHRQRLLNVVVGGLGGVGGEIQQRGKTDVADAGGQHAFHRRRRVKVHIGKGGGAGLQHFGDGKLDRKSVV